MYNPADRFNLLFLSLLSLLFCIDLFLFPGRPITFDSPTHITTIAQFYTSLRSGEVPVRWSGQYANYGMPLPELAHQTIAYGGALINALVNNVVLAHNLVVAFGAVASTLALYWLLRLHFSPFSSAVAAFLFSYAPYRITNIYIRGDIPEFYAGVFLPLILIGFYYAFKKHSGWGLALSTLATAFLLLTHPMMLVIGMALILPYIWYLTRSFSPSVLLTLTGTFGIAVLLSGYYIVPLVLELKYFYYGLTPVHLRPGDFLSLTNYLDPQWYFFKPGTHPGPRGVFISFGLIELGITLAAVPLAFIKKTTAAWPKLWLGAAAVLIFLTLPPSTFLYRHVPLLDGLQMPYRMFSALIYIPPFLLAYYLHRVPKAWWVGVIIALSVCLLRFPQLYGKNYVVYPEAWYYKTTANLHGEILNTIWTGNTKNYPAKDHRADIVSGTGSITQSQVTNTQRTYMVSATTQVRLVDYTFYFPGWKLTLDGVPATIEFQDPNYRGVITYTVPAGEHTVSLQYTDTKIRTLGNLTTLTGIIGLIICYMFGNSRRIGFTQLLSPQRRSG